MISSIGFLSPFMLVGLVVLPLIWLILRMTPPRPVTLEFPPTRILRGLEDADHTPARTPWWLTALRLLLAALIIFALAQPILKPEETVSLGDGPLLLVLDNGWDTAPDFEQRRIAAENAIREAARSDRPVAFIATADGVTQTLVPGDAATAENRLASIEPQPFQPDRIRLAEALSETYEAGSAAVLWIAGPVMTDDVAALADTLANIASTGNLMTGRRALTVLGPPQNGIDALTVPVQRLGAEGSVLVAGFDGDGTKVVEEVVTLQANSSEDLIVDLPSELRNALTRFSVTDEASAGAVQLLDSSAQRKPVGLVSGTAGDQPQPLLEPLTYVQRAMAPYSDLIVPNMPTSIAAINGLIDRRASVIVLADVGDLPEDLSARLAGWVEAGGTLVRFAGPRSATDRSGLMPVELRAAERNLGGALSWDEPQAIERFFDESPFANIEIPTDVLVNRQILADPDSLLNAEVWAELVDGTPLVTARGLGAGRLILFHVTADPNWSSLPLSGAFVEMLKAIADTSSLITATIDPVAGDGAGAAGPGSAGALGGGAASEASAPWQALTILDGFGHLIDPEGGINLIADIDQATPSGETPPGVYVRSEVTKTINAVTSPLQVLAPSSIGWPLETRALTLDAPRILWPFLLAAAAFLALVDALLVISLSGRFSGRRLASAGGATIGITTLAVALMLMIVLYKPAVAQDITDLEKALDATTETRLAYVLTGIDSIDQTSQAGLTGLGLYLANRTALEPGEPIAVDLAKDELAFYSLLYWPIDADSDVPPANIMAKVGLFMRSGGTILFDTRDAGGPVLPGTFAPTAETEKLREILSYIDVPALEPVPDEHVLTKAFYLLNEFPGRWRDSQLWVESLPEETEFDADRPARGGDGVSPILITGNDFAASWAVAEDGRYLYPTVPSDPRQRELAFRSGVNIVMYTLTGNYKADQVHIPALLERLGQ